MREPTPVHYLRPNERDYTPRALIILDTETRTVQGGETEVLGLRLWVATYWDRKVAKGVRPRYVTGWGRGPRELADWIESVTRNRESVWLYAHNLGFDLTTTRLPLWLVRGGWAISDAAVGGKAPWLRMKRGKRVLTMVDSWSWLPKGLDAVGEAVRVPKLPLPDEGDAEHVWRARCGWDVFVLLSAITELMDWWDRNKLGNWTLTGAACGWNAYRHRETGTRVLIDPSPEAVARDRLMVHGGRRGTWAIGEHRAGPFLELDFQSAYPQIAAEMPHPIGRAYTFDRLDLDDGVLASERWGVLARVRCVTEVAHFPVRIGEATWYPVGEFWADLAGPDIREAQRLGILREVGPGEAHRLGYNMSSWGRWVQQVERGELPDTPAVAKMAAKSWGRAVIGKWASRSFVKTKLGPSPAIGWGYEQGWDNASQSHGGMVDLAGQRWWISSAGDPDNAYPAVLAWIESEVRVRLGRVVAAIGEGAILQCDTDGLIVAQRVLGTKAARGHLVAPQGLVGQSRVQWVLNCLHPVTAPLNLRIKNRLGHVAILGPQHIQADGQRRFAGVPTDAQLGEDGRYESKLWPSFQWQLSNADHRGYVRPTRRYKVEGPYPTGWILRDKRVVPVETNVRDNGEVYIVPWHLTRYAKAGLHRADVQHPQLEDII